MSHGSTGGRSPCGALASHEPTSARKPKLYWREHWTESVNVLAILVSELIDTGVEDASPERCSRADRGAARNPLSGDRPDGGESRVPMVARSAGSRSIRGWIPTMPVEWHLTNWVGAASIAAPRRLSLSNKRWRHLMRLSV